MLRRAQRNPPGPCGVRDTRDRDICTHNKKPPFRTQYARAGTVPSLTYSHFHCSTGGKHVNKILRGDLEPTRRRRSPRTWSTAPLLARMQKRPPSFQFRECYYPGHLRPPDLVDLGASHAQLDRARAVITWSAPALPHRRSGSPSMIAQDHFPDKHEGNRSGPPRRIGREASMIAQGARAPRTCGKAGESRLPRYRADAGRIDGTGDPWRRVSRVRRNCREGMAMAGLVRDHVRVKAARVRAFSIFLEIPVFHWEFSPKVPNHWGLNYCASRLSWKDPLSSRPSEHCICLPPFTWRYGRSKPLARSATPIIAREPPQ